MAMVIDAKRNTPFPLKLTNEERADLESFVADRNAELEVGRVTMSDVVRAAIREYIERRTQAEVA